MGFTSVKMVRYNKFYKTCKHEKRMLNDFSYYESFGDTERVPHHYCTNCCVRWWKGKEYNPVEWDAYVNG